MQRDKTPGSGKPRRAASGGAAAAQESTPQAPHKSARRPGLRLDFDMQALQKLAEDSAGILKVLREEMLKPHPRKNPPEFNGSQVARLCRIDPKQVSYLAGRGDLPAGRAVGNRRMFTLAEARVWVNKLGRYAQRPPGAAGAVLACVNFKGGSTKTTTAFNLAQGLTLRGRRVLLVDIDPQASATTLTGLLPAAEVEADQTVAPITYPRDCNPPSDLRYAVQPTYWDGLDLIPAAPHLYNAEILLPIHSRDPDIRWWDLVRNALDPLRADYDVILFDTAPALSYLAVNAMMAADGLIMPIPPESLDYASSIAFWDLMAETMAGLKHHRGVDKNFAFMRVLISRVDPNSVTAKIVKEWIGHTYGPYVLQGEIPRSQVNTAGAVQFGSVYDISRYDGDQRTYKKIREAFDRFVEQIDDQITTKVWRVHPEEAP